MHHVVGCVTKIVVRFKIMCMIGLRGLIESCVGATQTRHDNLGPYNGCEALGSAYV